MDKRKQAQLIAGFSGVGKTTLAEKYANVLDLEIMPFYYLVKDYENCDKEAAKGNAARERNPDWPGNYIKALEKLFINTTMSVSERIPTNCCRHWTKQALSTKLLCR